LPSVGSKLTVPVQPLEVTLVRQDAFALRPATKITTRA
jgi:hypothetical protein